MARPSTRQGRLAYYRKRHTNRLLRRSRKRVKWKYAGEFGLYSSDAWQHPKGPLLKLGAYFVTDPWDHRLPVPQPGPTYFVFPAAHVPKSHVKVVNLDYLEDVGEFKRHRREAYVGWHWRSVHRRLRKPDRFTGAMRRIWGAAWFARTNGQYPLWDPLQRKPQEGDEATLPEYTHPDGWWDQSRPFHAPIGLP